jgi:hypothetical protein
MTSPKEQFDEHLQNILAICMEMPSITDDEWVKISNSTKELFKLKEALTRLQLITVEIDRNRYYNKYIVNTPPPLVTAQEKATDDKFICCSICKRTVKITNLSSHQESTLVCMNIRLTLEMEARYLKSKVAWKQRMYRFFERNRKTFIGLNIFISSHLRNREPKGRWWIYNLDRCMYSQFCM